MQILPLLTHLFHQGSKGEELYKHMSMELHMYGKYNTYLAIATCMALYITDNVYYMCVYFILNLKPA